MDIAPSYRFAPGFIHTHRISRSCNISGGSARPNRWGLRARESAIVTLKEAPKLHGYWQTQATHELSKCCVWKLLHCSCTPSGTKRWRFRPGLFLLPVGGLRHRLFSHSLPASDKAEYSGAVEHRRIVYNRHGETYELQ